MVFLSRIPISSLVDGRKCLSIKHILPVKSVHFVGSYCVNNLILYVNEISSILRHCPVTGLEWPRVFQEVKVPRLHDNDTGWL